MHKPIKTLCLWINPNKENLDKFRYAYDAHGNANRPERIDFYEYQRKIQELDQIYGTNSIGLVSSTEIRKSLQHICDLYGCTKEEVAIHIAEGFERAKKIAVSNGYNNLTISSVGMFQDYFHLYQYHKTPPSLKY